MALEPIGDIANPTLTDNTVTAETLTWETDLDWDNAADEKGVVHEALGDLVSTQVQLGWSTSMFTWHHFWTMDEDSAPITDYGNNPADLTENASGALTYGSTGDVNTTAIEADGSQSSHALETGSTGETFNDDTYVALVYRRSDKPYYWDQGSNRQIIGIGTFYLATDNIGYYDGSWHDTGMSIPNNEWVMIAVVMDGSTGTAYKRSESGATGSASATFSNPAWDAQVQFWGGETNMDGIMAVHGMIDKQLSTSEVDDLWDALNTGYLTTGTKSFSNSFAPDLQNLAYSLNGESITLDVIGSPGTASEEIVSQTLDGATSYTLTWSNTHTDFRIKANLDTSTITTSPVVDRLELAN